MFWKTNDHQETSFDTQQSNNVDWLEYIDSAHKVTIWWKNDRIGSAYVVQYSKKIEIFLPFILGVNSRRKLIYSAVIF